MWDIFNLKTLLIAFLVFAPLERLFAMHQGKKILRDAWKLDLFYALVNSLITKAGLTFVILASVALASSVVPASIQDGISAMPIWVQLPIAILLSDIGFYSVHRTFHKVPWLWKFHSIHHSIEELDWLAGHRVHPVDQILTKGASLVPVFALGFSELTVAIYAGIYYWQSLLVHSNVDLRLGPLRWVVALPQFHHWHHANHREAYDKNFAGQLSFLDAMFGTLHLPAHAVPERYGTPEPVPKKYVDQFFYPLRPAVATANPDAVVPRETEA